MKLAKDITFDDITQWIDAGYFFFTTENGERIIGRAIHFPRSDAPFIVAETDGGKTYEITNFGDITLHWPECGYVNVPYVRAALRVTRLQRRQWCRTYNPHCVNVTLPCSYSLTRLADDKELRAYREVQRASNFKLITHLFEPNYPNYQGALVLLNNDKWGTVALTRNTLLHKTEEDSYDLYYRGDYAGNITNSVFNPTNQTIIRKVMKLFNGAVSL